MHSTTLPVWDSTVATAADQTPQWNTARNSQSRKMFSSEEKIR